MRREEQLEILKIQCMLLCRKEEYPITHDEEKLIKEHAEKKAKELGFENLEAAKRILVGE